MLFIHLKKLFLWSDLLWIISRNTLYSDFTICYKHGDNFYIKIRHLYLERGENIHFLTSNFNLFKKCYHLDINWVYWDNCRKVGVMFIRRADWMTECSAGWSWLPCAGGRARGTSAGWGRSPISTLTGSGMIRWHWHLQTSQYLLISSRHCNLPRVWWTVLIARWGM